jgi:hypothetical protein
MDQPDYTSVDAKLGRAVTHYQILHGEIEKWAHEGKTYPTLHDDAQHTHHTIRWHYDGATPDFLGWTLVIGDCINNLRCALDHLIYAIAKFKSLKSSAADIERLAFIIADTPEKWENINNQARIGVDIKKGTSLLGSKVVEALRSLQPFNRSHPQIPPLLAILREFSNADKHRLLQVANAAVVEWDLSFWARGGAKFDINRKPIQNGDIVCVVETLEPDPYFTVQTGKIGTSVALWHGLRNGDTDPFNDRTDVSILIPFLLNEVKYAIDVVKYAATEN